MLEDIKKYPKYSTALIVAFIIIDIFFSVINAVDLVGFIGVAALIIASALFACLIILTRSLYIFLMAVPSFIISLILSGEIIYAFIGLAYIPLGFMISFGLRQKLSRTQIILRLSAVITVFYILAFVLMFILSMGKFSIGSVKNIIDQQAEEVIDYYIDYYNSFFTRDNVGQSRYDDTGQYDANRTVVMSESDRHDYVESLKAIIPAVFIWYCTVISFFITFVFRILYNIIVIQANPDEEVKRWGKIQRNDWKLTMSLVSTVIFVLCIFFVMFFSGMNNIWAVITVTNVIYILAPGLFIIGFHFIHEKIKLLCKNNYISVVLIFVFIGVILLLFSSFIIMAFIFCGVYSIQIVELKKFVEKKKKSFDDFTDDD